MPAYGVSFGRPANEALDRMRVGVKTPGFRKVVGTAGVQAFRDHYTAREADGSTHRTASALGARPQGIFAQFARQTFFEDGGFSVSIVTSHPAIRQRLQGGTIRPVNGRYLTIPANSFAYGRRAREVGVDLVFAYAPRGNETTMVPALIAPDAVEKEVGAKRKDGTRRKKTIRPAGIYYWLVRQVTQRGDPATVPTKDAVVGMIIETTREWIEEQKKGGGNG